MIRDSYDVIVVGGGPGGAVSAWFAARGGASVLLLEKDRDIGIPVRCAEAIGQGGLQGILEPDPHFIAHEINSLRFIAPDGTRIDIQQTDEVGYMLNRRIFDQELGRKAASAGAQIITHAYVSGLIKNSDSIRGVKVRFPAAEKEIRAKIVIGADGVESRVGRWAGLRTFYAPKDLESCYQVVLGGITVDKNLISLYFGNEVAPGGYAWVFPKGDDIANVGIGVSAAMIDGINAKKHLDQFIERHFPKASILACVSGGVPSAKPFKKIHGSGIMLVGDAAAHASPLTGGGISNAIAAGRLAGEIAAKCIADGSWNEKDLSVYTRMWDKRWGDNQRRLYRLKETVFKLSDDVFNKAAAVLVSIPTEERSIKKIIATTLKNNPKILLELARTFF